MFQIVICFGQIRFPEKMYIIKKAVTSNYITFLTFAILLFISQKKVDENFIPKITIFVMEISLHYAAAFTCAKEWLLFSCSQTSKEIYFEQNS